MEYPVERIRWLPSVSPAYLLDLCQSFGVIARVVITSLTPEYPVRTPRGITYPIGTYTTTLAGPELLAACAAGEVTHVHRAAMYRLGNPFARAMDPLLRLRSEYHEQGQTGWELFVKSIMVSMSGRLAPHQYHWLPRPTTPALIPWGEWTVRDHESGSVRRFLSRSGLTWERTHTVGSIRPMAAAYAYLTAYGRTLMRLYRSRLPPRCVLAQDTDGLWCTSIARSTLGYLTDPDAAQSGDLRRKFSCRAARFWTGQHYWCGGRWVLAGIRSPSLDPGTATLRGSLEIGGLDRVGACPRPLTLSTSSTIDLHERAAQGTVSDDGWIAPPHIHQDHG